MKLLLLIFLGASLGSFLGLVIDRFPDQSIVFPASHCNHCKRPLKAWDLIPILSQLLTRSKCRYCKAKIPYWYLLLESLSALLVVLVAYQVLSYLEGAILLCGLVLALYDIREQSFPFMVWLVFTAVCLILSQLHWVFCAFLFLAYLAQRYDLKIGAGDFLYLATLSLLFDYHELLWVVQISSVLGLAVFFTFKSKSLPYVPFLFLAGILVQWLG